LNIHYLFGIITVPTVAQYPSQICRLPGRV